MKSVPDFRSKTRIVLHSLSANSNETKKDIGFTVQENNYFFSSFVRNRVLASLVLIVIISGFVPHGIYNCILFRGLRSLADRSKSTPVLYCVLSY